MHATGLTLEIYMENVIKNNKNAMRGVAKEQTLLIVKIIGKYGRRRSLKS